MKLNESTVTVSLLKSIQHTEGLSNIILVHLTFTLFHSFVSHTVFVISSRQATIAVQTWVVLWGLSFLDTQSQPIHVLQKILQRITFRHVTRPKRFNVTRMVLCRDPHHLMGHIKPPQPIGHVLAGLHTDRRVRPTMDQQRGRARRGYVLSR